MADYYLVMKALHIIAVIAWMAGLLYLPRLFVYHAETAKDSPTYAVFNVMERRLLRYIMNPAMICSFILGILLIMATDAMTQGWLHTKLLLVLIMAGLHGRMAWHRKQFAAHTNTYSGRYFRVLNEAPTLLMIIIVFLAVLKPF